MRIGRLTTSMGILALAFSTLCLPVGAVAGTQAQPTLFALQSTDFPVGSLVVRAGEETNRQLLGDDPVHFGVPPAIMGRITGYYMSAHRTDQVGNQQGYTSYLVSIFASRRQAQAAYMYRWSMWFKTNYFTAPPDIRIPVGDARSAALFHGLPPDLGNLWELFFRRGTILVETFQDADPRLERTLYRIAKRLDRIASKHRRGL